MRRWRTTQSGSTGYVVKKWKAVAPRKGRFASTSADDQGIRSTRIAVASSTETELQKSRKAQPSARSDLFHCTIAPISR